MDGTLLALRAEEGRARPYELGELRLVLREVLSAKALEAWEWILAAERGFGGHNGGLRVRHADMARMLGCCQRAAGDAVRELVELGLVEQRPWFRTLSDTERGAGGVLEGKLRHRELRPRYVTAKKGHAVIAFVRSKQVGNKCQPGGIQRTLRVHEKGKPGRGRPARSFVQDVKRALAPSREPLSVARLIERLPDGRVLLGSALSADAVAQKLRTGRLDGDTREKVDDDPIARAWRAFEARGRA